MGTVAFDTYRFVKHLTASGFTEQQAEALAEEQTAILNGNLATKADIGLVKADIGLVKVELEGAIERFKVDLKSVIDQAKYETIKWTIGIVSTVAAVQTTVIVQLLS